MGRRPQLCAGLGIEGDDPLAAREHAQGVDAPVGNGYRGIPGPEAVGSEDEARTALRPALQESGLPGDAVPVGAAPLRPVLAGGGGEWDQREGGGERRKSHSGATPVASQLLATGNAAARSASRCSWSRRPASPASRSPGATLSGPGISAMKT